MALDICLLRMFHLHRLALIACNQFLKFFKCHTAPLQDILPQDTPSQALKQPITQPLSLSYLTLCNSSSFIRDNDCPLSP